jgi:hypothetical protein
MTTPDDAPLREAWDLFMAMGEELAVNHGNAVYAQQAIDDGWDDLPGRISDAETSLYTLVGPSDTRQERKQGRHERHEIAGINETLGETYQALVERAAAQTDYLTLEAEAKDVIAAGEQPDMVTLDRASERVNRAHDRLEVSSSTLSYRIENLSAEADRG